MTFSMRIILVWFIFMIFESKVIAQCPTSSFSSATEVCIGQNVILENSSLNGTEYEWDFCTGDLLEIPDATEVVSNNLIFRNRDIKVVQNNGSWFAFAIDQASAPNRILRFDFGASLTNVPIITNLGNPQNLLNSALGLYLLEENGLWYAFVANTGSNDLLKLSFGSELTNVPSIESLGDFSILNSPNGLTMIQDGDLKYLFVTNGGTSEVIMLKFQNTINSEPTINTFLISGGSSIRAVDVIKECDKWVGIVTSFSNNKVYLVDFIAGLNNTPAVNQITFGGNFFFPISVKIMVESNQYFAFVQSSVGVLYRLDFGSSISDNIGIGQNFGNLIGSSDNSGTDWIFNKSQWSGFVLDFTNRRLVKYDFPNVCSAIEPTSEYFDPLVSYSQAGDYNITLKATDDNGNVDYMTKSITITTDTAPTITTTSQNICLSNPINFTSTSDQALSSQIWDFGDTNTSTDPNPSYTYAVAGEYEVTLQVQSTNGCNNFTKQMITIYDEPVPNFTLPSGTICTNEDYTFVNNTIDNFDGNLTYEWQVDGVTVGTDPELIHQFTTGGAKDITLITSIPGCDIEQVQMIANVSQGAIPFYTYDTNNTCQSDPITFTNLSSGENITDYFWGFGDANNSTDTDPTHTYTSAGQYTVSLAVTNSAGCITNYQENITVHSLPSTDFSAELACTDRNTQLTDLTTVDNANITSWDWDFGDTASGSDNISAEENPVHSFSGIGDFGVVLSTTTDFGCENSIEKVITVYESPTVDFEIDAACVENAFLFTDLSIPNTGGSIVSRTWSIDGSIYTVPNPSHTFSTAGDYLATLTIRSDNNCTISVSRTVTVNELPTSDFSLSSYCANTESTLTDTSILDNDEIVDWQWTINGQSIGNTATIAYTFDEAATYEVDLQIITARGCIVSTSKVIDVFELPTADFEPSIEYSASPAEISFDNLSNNAVVYQWDFGDGSETSSDVSPTHTYTDLGVYDVTLTTESAEGCFDEVTKQIHVVIPAIDLSLDEINTFDEGKRVLLTVSNHGTIPVGDISAIVSLNNELSINEALDLVILPNETSIPKTLSFTLPENGNIDFICITLSTSEGADLNEADNTQCINITDDFKILVPYPSPVSEGGLLTVPLIGEKNNEVTIALVDTKGKQHMSESVQLSQKGLNNIGLSLTRLKPGIYFIQVQSPKTTKSFRIFVN